MPTRQITSSPVKVTGSAPDSQQFESALEEDFFVLLRFNRLVKSFEAQPVTIEWQDDNKAIRPYTPDVLVRYRNDLPEATNLCPVLCEVKPDFTGKTESPRRQKPPRKENERENELKWEAARHYAARQGWEFKVYRESEIKTPYWHNARFLLRYVERDQSSKYEQELLAWIAARGTATLEEWASIRGSDLRGRATMYPSCYRLIGLQQVDVDLTVPLTKVSLVKALPSA